MTARLHGRITQWFDDRGYGFITAAGGSKQVFLHISALNARGVRPKPGDRVTFLLDRDAEGRLRAKAVQYVGTAVAASTSQPVGWALPVLGIGTALGLALASRVPWWVPGLYVIASAAAWLLYGWDKGRAEAQASRVPENTLHALALLGGWPGALIAQAQFRHKTRKTSFRVVFWLTVVLNVAALGWIAVEGGAPLELLGAILDAAFAFSPR
jgi:uncharacterized membrane protein YsdA (DUF1294 family)/cold shock CspA family protein